MDNEYVEQAVEIEATDDAGTLTLDEYVDRVLDNPTAGCASTEYLVRAIEHFGTRTVTEHGEQMERWRFFDDPANDGEHAILGNTKRLNAFVEDLRQQAAGSANEEKLFWFEGPTATGKSEIKRCLTNGLREFSRTDEGRRYTVEWNVSQSDTEIRYVDGDMEPSDETDWFQSPIQSSPLTVLPRETREQIMRDAGIENAHDYAKIGIDPFSAEAVDILERRYGSGTDAYEQIYSDEHLRVVPYEMDAGRGIGVLQSDDDGKPKHKLSGQWMEYMLKEYDSRGRRNPQAFAFDGFLSQGNAGVSIVEDAVHHVEMLTKLLNVMDDDVVKIDRRIRMPVDTVILILSNMDLDGILNQVIGSDDAAKALRRRMEKYRMFYLVTLDEEVQLLQRLITNEPVLWDDDEAHSVREPLHVNGTEIAPHTVATAAVTEIATRTSSFVLTDVDLTELQLIELFNTGTVEVDGEEIDIDDIDTNGDMHGRDGIPCIYVRDVMADLIAENDLIMPHDVIDAMLAAQEQSAIFGGSGDTKLDEVYDVGFDYAREKQTQDVLAAMLREKRATKEDVAQYVEHVYSWGTDEDTVEPDPLVMKTFETTHLGFSDDDYSGVDAGSDVESFRREEIITGITRWLYDNAEEFTFEADELDFREIDVLDDVLSDSSWDDVFDMYEDLDLSMWDDPLDNTQTETVKEQTIENMVEMFDYTDQSAEETARIVVNNHQNQTEPSIRTVD